jgi:hypothetical protein
MACLLEPISLALSQHAPSVKFDFALSLNPIALTLSPQSPTVVESAGRTYMVFENDYLSIVVKGVEVARFQSNGTIDVNSTVNENAF